MDKILRPKFLFIAGGVCVGIGFLVPLLMVGGFIPMWLWLELIVGVLQMIGLMFGIIGSVLYVKERRK